MLAYDWNFLGLSTENKPTAGEKVVDGSTYYECDTSLFYIYYNGEWYQQTFITEDGINFWLYKDLMRKMFGKWFDGNISLAKIISPDTGTEIEFTTAFPAQITDLIGYGDSTQGTDPAPTPDDPQAITVVTGEQTVTIDGSGEYTIDLGAIELCKIGGYQDYIYKSGDDWYVHKDCGKYVIDGSENWIHYQDSIFYADNISMATPVNSTIRCYSNYYLGVNSSSNVSSFVQSTNNLSFAINTHTRQSLIRIKDTRYTQASDLVNWFITHNTYLYYAIATPTDTKITDTTLISNLNSLLNYIFPVGDHQLVITADDLPMALKLTITEKE